MLAKRTSWHNSHAVGWKSWLIKEWSKHRYLYLMALPIVAYFVIFKYIPMYGLIVAFKQYSPRLGIAKSAWVGINHFTTFFQSFYFIRLLNNTFLLSLYNMVWGFPMPILLALLLNEVTATKFKRTVQTITYMPNFISLVVVCGILKDFLVPGGAINTLVLNLGGTNDNLLLKPELFRTIYIASGIWQTAGFSSIIYLAAISGVDAELYEAAAIDGITSRFKQAIHITLPCIMPTIIILFILQVGGLMNVGFEKVLLLYNDRTLEVADVISTFVYRKGLQDFNYSYSAAVGLFNSVINCVLLISANWMSGKLTETGLW